MNEIYETLDKNYVKFENKTIRVIIDNNEEFWFNANESAEALGYKRPRETIKEIVDIDERKYLSDINAKIKTGTQPKTIYLSEAGLYNLILQSRLPKAKKFKKWVTSEVLPSIRKYGFYKLKKEHEEEIGDIMKNITYLKKENETLKNDMKKDKFPNGGMVYAINFSDDNQEVYRIGKTGDMKLRKSIYNTHMLHNKEVKCEEETNCPVRLETCVRSMLYKYRYKDNKDFYICGLNKVEKAFKTCVKSIECMEQTGGGESFIMKEIKTLETKKSKLKIKLDKVIAKLKN